MIEGRRAGRILLLAEAEPYECERHCQTLEGFSLMAPRAVMIVSHGGPEDVNIVADLIKRLVLEDVMFFRENCAGGVSIEEGPAGCEPPHAQQAARRRRSTRCSAAPPSIWSLELNWNG
jgi:hypothetical protein